MVPDLIFDIGMHEGWDTAYYLAKGFRVVAVDANPYLCASAEEQFSREISQGRLTIRNVGIAEDAGFLDFYIAKNKNDWSSFKHDFAARFDGDVEVRQVECIRLNQLLTEFGIPYYLKIDIEGHDRSAVMSLKEFKEYPRYVSVEATVSDFCQIMVPLGYNRFKLVNQVHTNLLPPRFPPLEGGFTDMKLIPGKHSGPFGDETYGDWLTEEDFNRDRQFLRQKRYEGSFQQAAGVPENLFDRWSDFHAKLSAS